MKKIITYKDWKFEVDFDRTKETYDKVELGGPEACVCNNCKNFVANRENLYPDEIKLLLAKLGVDYKKESEVVQFYKLENGKHYYGGWFHFKGKVIEGKDCTVKLPNGGVTFDLTTISDDFEIGFWKSADLSFFTKEESESLIEIEFAVNSDWVIDKELEEV